MKTAVLPVVAALIWASLVPSSLEAKMLEKNNFDFAPSEAELRGGDVQYLYYLSEKNTPSELRRSDRLYSRIATSLGKIDNSNDQMHALIVRAVYVVARPMERYVRHEVLNDLNYLRIVLDSPNMRKLAASVFEVPRKGNSPGFRFERELVVSAANVERDFGAKLKGLPLKSLEGDVPFTLQDSDQFSKILGQDTSKDARMISAYYPYGNDGFMVDSYTLSHLYNVPPGFMGGTKRLKEDFLKAVEGSIKRGQAHRP